MKRIAEMEGNVAATNQAASWYHLVSSYKADTGHGVRCERDAQSGRLTEKWYVNHIVLPKAEGEPGPTVIPVPAYPDHEFLAIDYRSSTGDFELNEKITVKEFWTKPNPTATDDVYPFRDTEITITTVKAVSDLNLLPEITYKDAYVADYRFANPPLELPLLLPLKKMLWVTQDSKSWPLLDRLNAQAEKSGWKVPGKIIVVPFRPAWPRYLLFTLLWVVVIGVGALVIRPRISKSRG